MSRALSILVLVVVVGISSRISWAGRAAKVEGVAFEQRLDEQVPADLDFTDESGCAVKLGDYFGGKPVILVLTDYRCAMLCTLQLNALVQAVRDMPVAVGNDVQVVVVSFDARETPKLAAAKKKNCVGQLARPGAAMAWHFLTGKAEPIERLTSAVGFRYVYDAAHDDFLHTGGIVLLTPGGHISRYFYDSHYSGRELRLALASAAAGKIGPAVEHELLYCFHFDPELGRYSKSVLNIVRVGGALTVGLLAAMTWYLMRGSSRTQNSALGTEYSVLNTADSRSDERIVLPSGASA